MPLMIYAECPRCGSDQVYRSRRNMISDELLKLVGIRAYRCHYCNSTHHGLFRLLKRTAEKTPVTKPDRSSKSRSPRSRSKS